MQMLERLASILAALSFCVAASWAATQRQVYVYQDTSTGRKLTYDTEKMTFTNGHLIVSMHACPREYRCLRGGPIDFVLPVNWHSVKEWTLQAAHFKLKEDGQFPFLGHYEPVSIIEGTLSDANVRYFYSATRGLIGVEVSGPAVQSTLTSASPCGFAADKCPS